MSVKLTLAALLMGGTILASTANAQTIDEDAAAFGARAVAGDVSISPDGKKVVFLGAKAGSSSSATVFDLATGQTTAAITSAGASDSLYWCGFSGNATLVCKFGGNMSSPTGLIPYSRLVRVDLDGKNLKPLGQASSAYDESIRQFDGDIIDWLPSGTGQVLMERRYVAEANRLGTRLVKNKSGLGVDRIDTVNVKATSIEAPNPQASSYMTDGQGNVRLMFSEQADSETGILSGKTEIYYRKAGSRGWDKLATNGVDSSTDIIPLAVETQSNNLFFLRKLNGRNALYKMPLDGTMASTLVASNPKVDIDNVIRIGRGQTVIGYTYATEDRASVYFDPTFKSLAAGLGKALPKTPLINFVDASADGQKLIIFGGSDVAPGTYYYFDRATKELSPLTDVRPLLAKKVLNPVKSVSYTTRDGQTVPAYLTMPAGAQGKKVPAVVLPHGGPSARDEWGFDWIVQFLAARGYAVIQPQFRGSAGFGDEFQNGNAFRNWQTAINDVNDAAQYLVTSGISDASKVAIVGWSYGGYAALQAAAIDPSRYKAVVAIAPVTDFALYKEEKMQFTNGSLIAEAVGSGEHIRAGSPLRNAAAIKAPVLLVHGDLDVNVGSAHSTKMESALKSAGTPVEYLHYPKHDHYLEDSAVRTEMLSKMGKLLDRTIGQ